MNIVPQDLPNLFAMKTHLIGIGFIYYKIYGKFLKNFKKEKINKQIFLKPVL